MSSLTCCNVTRQPVVVVYHAAAQQHVSSMHSSSCMQHCPERPACFGRWPRAMYLGLSLLQRAPVSLSLYSTSSAALASNHVQCLNPCDAFAIGMHLAYEATVIASKYQTGYIVVVHAAVSALAAHACETLTKSNTGDPVQDGDDHADRKSARAPRLLELFSAHAFSAQASSCCSTSARSTRVCSFALAIQLACNHSPDVCSSLLRLSLERDAC
jgi:hypothetical protein